MAVTKIDIASRALIMIGSNPISSFTDDTTEALVTNNIYEEIIFPIILFGTHNVRMLPSKTRK